jgi:hypothetical protein
MGAVGFCLIKQSYTVPMACYQWEQIPSEPSLVADTWVLPGVRNSKWRKKNLQMHLTQRIKEVNDKSFSVVAVRVSNPGCLPVGINRWYTAPIDPALLRLSAMISQYFTPGFCPFFALQSNAKVNVNPLALGSS